MTSASGRPTKIAEPPRRTGLRLWMLVVLVAAVGLPLGVSRRWETFRMRAIANKAAAEDYGRLAVVSVGTAQRYARSAELAETMAATLGPLLGAEQRKLAEADRIREREAGEQWKSYERAMDDESARADVLFNRW